MLANISSGSHILVFAYLQSAIILPAARGRNVYLVFSFCYHITGTGNDIIHNFDFRCLHTQCLAGYCNSGQQCNNR